MTTVFIAAIGFCLYTYFVFPLILHWRAHRGQFLACENATPASLDRTESVSIVIAAHNEANNLPAKFDSLDKLVYPAQHLECVFVSDGSTDGTLALLESACSLRDNWRVEHYSPALGKPSALNVGVATAKGDVIVFMDARQSVSCNTVQALVNRLFEDNVGVVSGELVLADDRGQEAANVGLYWRYEKWIRSNESSLFSTTGATGALYAIRRCDYQPLPIDALLDDFDTPVSLLRHGKRTVFEPLAKAFDQAEAKSADEFRRKARTLTGNFQSFKRHPWLFNPVINPVWWQFVSHKVCRLLVPYALLIALVACVLGNTSFLQLMLALQLGFYTLGVLGMLGVDNSLTKIIKVFLQLNAAAVVGAWRAARGSNGVRWKAQ